MRSFFTTFKTCACIALLSFAACSTDSDEPQGAYAAFEVKNQEVSFGSAATSQDITLKSNTEWDIVQQPNTGWLTIDKTSGTNTQVVKFSVEENTGDYREAQIKARVKLSGIVSVITVKQAGVGGGTQEGAIYYEAMGTSVATESGIWPAVSQYEGWSKAGTNTQTAAAYSGSGTVRDSGSEYAPTAGSSFSGQPYVYMKGNNSQFAVSSIDITGSNRFILRFGALNTVDYQDATGPVFGAVDKEKLKVYAGFDGEKWAELSYVNDGVKGWSWSSAEFTTPETATKLYVKIEIASGEIRLDDIMLHAGGNGPLIDPGNEGPVVEKTIAEIRAMFAGSPVTIAENIHIKGSIISDASAEGDNTLSSKNIIISDGQAGIMLRLVADPTVEYNLGDEVTVKLKDVQLASYLGLLQFNNIPEANITKTGNTVTPNCPEITTDQLKTGQYESMMVEVTGVQFSDDAVGKPINDPTLLASDGHASIKMENSKGDNLTLFVTKNAAFFKTPITLTDKSGSVKGIASVSNSVFQLLPQRASDLDGLTSERMTDVPQPLSIYFNEFDPAAKKIEIFNNGTKAADIAGTKIVRTNPSGSEEWVIPAGKGSIPAKGFIVYVCGSNGTDGPSFEYTAADGFKFEIYGADNALLDKADNLTAKVGILASETWGRRSDGGAQWVIFSAGSLGASNATGTIKPSESGSWTTIDKAADLTAGTYVIGFYNSVSQKWYALPTAVIAKNPTAVEIEVDQNNTLQSEAGAEIQWTLTGDNTDGFVVSSAAPSWLEAKNEAQGIKVVAAESAQVWKFLDDATDKLVMRNPAASGTRNLAVFYNADSSTATWRYYTTGTSYTGQLFLFKKSE